MKIMDRLRELLGLPPRPKSPCETLRETVTTCRRDGAESGSKLRAASERLEAEAARVRSGHATATK